MFTGTTIAFLPAVLCQICRTIGISICLELLLLLPPLLQVFCRRDGLVPRRVAAPGAHPLPVCPAFWHFGAGHRLSLRPGAGHTHRCHGWHRWAWPGSSRKPQLLRCRRLCAACQCSLLEKQQQLRACQDPVCMPPNTASATPPPPCTVLQVWLPATASSSREATLWSGPPGACLPLPARPCLPACPCLPAHLRLPACLLCLMGASLQPALRHLVRPASLQFACQPLSPWH